MSEPIGAVAADDPYTPAAAVNPGAKAAGSAAEVITGRADAESPPTVSATAEPGPVRPVPASSGEASPDARWHEIQATFVDDPRASVELAVGLVDNSVEALVASITERQHSLLSAWQGDDAGTEDCAPRSSSTARSGTAWKAFPANPERPLAGSVSGSRALGSRHEHASLFRPELAVGLVAAAALDERPATTASCLSCA
jgi:hypothetical protein